MVRLSIFPLAGALLFPRAHLPLHIFEPRYRALVSDAMARDRRIGMIQPRGEGARPPLFEVGCVGHIIDVQALEDGRFNLILEGRTRFRMLRELDVATPFRQIEADTDSFAADAGDAGTLAMMLRADIEREARRFAEQRGYVIDWDAVSRLDDESLVSAVAQVAPFDVATKQALLEASGLAERAELVAQLLRFFRLGDNEEGGTLQ
ncbi:LON peptidase substrate-binding domain-containing protein [Sphingomonas morindae]|uniref:LON peptidase substrate-binding domain-containing protein n=1 Tax=Sphingomonas morindae TaxID=1541170 RepID=A0ABY4XBP8_9SPHN|nr:LON peptidase substrate-binding domain-containing protein [Sphingomonas morindae]USI74310.1 LON peptidase substrate-binding domain-containing protein [Sphingomonas morindae]